MVKPFVILKYTTEVLLHNLAQLEKRLKARGKGVLQTIEECLRLFSFIVIKQHQEDVILHSWLAVCSFLSFLFSLTPSLKNLTDEYKYLYESYKFDHKRILSLIKKAIGKFSALKSKTTQDLDDANDPSIRALSADILEIVYLQTHVTRKQHTEMSPALDGLRPDEQCRIIRAVLDISPLQYKTHLLPWIVGSLVDDDQVCTNRRGN